MSDLISRQDIIGYIDRVRDCGLGKSKALEYISKYVERVPSAETTGALDDAIAKYVADGLMELPSDEAVEVVRCRDCKHRYISGNGTTRYYVCDFMDAQYEDNGFCHHGERKGGDDE